MHTCIIVTENWQDGKKTVVGFLVDSVREVVELPPDTIEPAPQMGASIDPEHIKGIGSPFNQFQSIRTAQIKIHSRTDIHSLNQG